MMRIASAAAIAALTALASVALAQTAPPSAPSAAAPSSAPQRSQDPEAKARFEKFRAACSADLATHCASVAKGERGEMRQCVETHKAKFSTGCQAAITERDANREARKQAAPSDKPKS